MVESKSKQHLDKLVKLLDIILKKLIDDLGEFVEKIIICDQEDLESEIKILDDSITITKLQHCTVNGKTISLSKKPNKSVILVTTNILIDMFHNIEIEKNNNLGD